jgi:hypothetical protein
MGSVEGGRASTPLLVGVPHPQRAPRREHRGSGCHTDARRVAQRGIHRHRICRLTLAIGRHGYVAGTVAWTTTRARTPQVYWRRLANRRRALYEVRAATSRKP